MPVAGVLTPLGANDVEKVELELHGLGSDASADGSEPEGRSEPASDVVNACCGAVRVK